MMSPNESKTSNVECVRRIRQSRVTKPAAHYTDRPAPRVLTSYLGSLQGQVGVRVMSKPRWASQ